MMEGGKGWNLNVWAKETKGEDKVNGILGGGEMETAAEVV